MSLDTEKDDTQASMQPIQGGVEVLLTRLRDEGVSAAKKEAAAIVDAAKVEADHIIEDAKKMASDSMVHADQQCKIQQSAAMETLHMAARDTVLSLQNHITKSLENYVKNLVTSVSFDPEIIKQLILSLAADASKQIDPKSHVDILFPASLLSKEDVMKLSSDMLRNGVSLYPSTEVHGGIYIKLEEHNLAWDLSDEAISELLVQFIVPKFRAMIVGED